MPEDPEQFAELLAAAVTEVARDIHHFHRPVDVLLGQRRADHERGGEDSPVQQILEAQAHLLRTLRAHIVAERSRVRHPCR